MNVMNKLNKQKWFLCLKSVVFASLAVFVVFWIVSIVLVAALMEIANESVRNAVLYLILMIAYAFFLNRFHMHKWLDTFAEHTNEFSPKKELLAYLHAEGKYILLVYGIAVILTEISCWILPSNAPNLIATATMFCLGPWMILKLPILRAVIAFAYASSLLCLLAILRSRKIHMQKTMLKKQGMKNTPR